MDTNIPSFLQEDVHSAFPQNLKTLFTILTEYFTSFRSKWRCHSSVGLKTISVGCIPGHLPGFGGEEP